jgi:hypothetical protein
MRARSWSLRRWVVSRTQVRERLPPWMQDELRGPSLAAFCRSVCVRAEILSWLGGVFAEWSEMNVLEMSTFLPCAVQDEESE